ncbi:bud site selection protein 16 [Coprinopsis marcescibilis]|uniref:pyridoxal kinase n=1 Tax=Coprinopsis marcescibilis TaxID=230819 RepID=A0A5C3KMU8_COPMA|nr:bud site selection protein 16 [Coprinopsis marcescibilis]
MQADRILSIQSHVVFGYVGGKAAVFPLQCMGYDVDVVNTVNFSNHSGYGRSGGSKATAAELKSIFESMEQNELLLPSRLLTGYIPGAEALSAVQALAQKLKNSKPSLLYLLDPVMGDAGRLYVAPDVIPVYREMLPLASIITPNWFEVELLTDIKLRDIQSLQRALICLHKRYRVPDVVISSIPLTPWLRDALPKRIQPPSDNDHLLCLSSSLSGTESNLTQATPSIVHAQCVHLIPGYFSGVGDLFAALLLGHFHPNRPTPSEDSTPLSVAVSAALVKTHSLLQFTHEQSLQLPSEERQPSDDELDSANPLRKTRRMRGRELALIQGQDIIRGKDLDNTSPLKPWDDFWKSYIPNSVDKSPYVDLDALI